MSLIDPMQVVDLMELAEQAAAEKLTVGNEGAELPKLDPEANYTISNEAGTLDVDSDQFMLTYFGSDECDKQPKRPSLSISSRAVEIDGEAAAAPIFYLNNPNFATIAFLANYTTPALIPERMKQVPWMFVCTGIGYFITHAVYSCIRRLTDIGIHTELSLPMMRDLESVYLLTAAKRIIMPCDPMLQIGPCISFASGDMHSITDQVSSQLSRQSLMIKACADAGLIDGEAVGESFSRGVLYQLNADDIRARINAYNQRS